MGRRTQRKHDGSYSGNYDGKHGGNYGRKLSRNPGRRRGGKVCSAAGMILIVLVILLCSLLVFPGMFGFHMYHVLSGSMEPAVPVGSLLYVRSVEPGDVEEEDIIAFYGALEDSGIITHRVVKNNVVSGTFITKGDANEKEDPEPVFYDAFIGKAVLMIPYMGRVLTIMTSLEGKISAACIIGMGVVLNLIGGKLKEQSEDASVLDGCQAVVWKKGKGWGIAFLCQKMSNGSV